MIAAWCSTCNHTYLIDNDDILKSVCVHCFTEFTKKDMVFQYSDEKGGDPSHVDNTVEEIE